MFLKKFHEISGVVAVQTFGDFQNFNPHLHIIATDGCFYGQGKFQKANRPCPPTWSPCSGVRC